MWCKATRSIQTLHNGVHYEAEHSAILHFVSCLVTLSQHAVGVRPLKTFSEHTAADLFSARVLSDMSPPIHATVCQVPFDTVTIYKLLNCNFIQRFKLAFYLISLNIELLSHAYE